MSKTRFERLETDSSSTAAFRISGKLGFHENRKVEQLAEECLKRNFSRVVFDLSGLSSLGGGVARILRRFIGEMSESGGDVQFVITNDVVLDFLRDGEAEIKNHATVESALHAPRAESGTVGKAPAAEAEDDESFEGPAEEDLDEKDSAESGVILMSYDGNAGESGSGGDEPIKDEVDGVSAEETGGAKPERDGIISSIFDGKEDSSAKVRESGPEKSFSISDLIDSKDEGELSRKLKRRILELKTLFAISADFNSIRDRKKLLEIFLLTSIAQGGVESAVFYDRKDGVFGPVLSKGLDEEKLPAFDLAAEEEEAIAGCSDVVSLDSVPVRDEIKKSLMAEGIEYICPFSGADDAGGIVMLGRRIAGRGMQKEDFEFMKVLVNIARGAYQNALMFEKENDRTLGIVKTLISLIEENTLLKGTSEFISRYVGMVAKNMNYPDEHFKDLVYGTVLRDMGMIKVSDLIVRSPRELTREEWEIIKRHPEDGAGMLRRMQFSDHVVDIVLCHHERFNGEGYPRGLRGRDIPLGARIISVVESYAAMINERPNRPALSGREALETLRENYGLRYDREVVKQFAMIIEKELAKSVKPADPVSQRT